MEEKFNNSQEEDSFNNFKNTKTSRRRKEKHAKRVGFSVVVVV